MPRYSDELIEEVRSRNDIVDVISQYVRLSKKGRSGYRLGIDGVHHHVHRRRTAFLHGNYGAVYCKDLHGGKAAPALYCCGEQPCRSDSD